MFDAIWRTRHVSRAAALLGVSQPTVSNALAQLRAHFGDRLFVRARGEMLPTPAAEQLGGPVAAAFAQLRDSLATSARFDSATSSRVFNLVMTDVGEIVFLAPLVAHCQRHAPQVSFRTRQLPAAAIAPALAAGEVDLALGFVPDLVAGVYQQRLFETEYVCLARTRHPSIGRTLTRRAFLAARHALAEAEGTGHYVVAATLAELGLERRIDVRVPQFLALPAIVARSELLATVPRPLADAFAGAWPVRALEHPIRLPRLVIKQFWHERFHNDPAGRWLRETVAQLFSDARAPQRA